MEKAVVEFGLNARRVYTAVKRLFETRTRFGAIECDDEHFVVEGRRGWWVSPFSERVRIKVVATGTQSCRVTIESESRSVLNVLNLGANSLNVQQLADYISNEVYRLCSDQEIRLAPNKINFRR